MKINVIHPGEQSLEVVKSAVEAGGRITRSPHVGNVNGNDLALIAGLGELGANLRLLMVDTIQGQDNYSNPRVVKTRHRSVPICSNKNSSGRVVGACKISQEGILDMKKLELGIDASESDSLVDVHMASFERILADNVTCQLGSTQFAGLGEKALRAVLISAHTVLDRPLRKVDYHGKISQSPDGASSSEVFGLGANPLQGVLVPLEAMMAVDMLEPVIANNGSDHQVIHVAGNDMMTYTQDEILMGRTLRIAKLAATSLGISSTTSVEYVLPGRMELLATSGFPLGLIPEDCISQYDLLGDSMLAN